ncbi:MAG: IPT/TIG domain-containing protein [Planctomycetota bacterium]|jgi:hypothetical protein
MRQRTRVALSVGGLAVALTLSVSLAVPTSTAAYSLLGESLDLGQRDVRVFNNFIDASANDNTIPHPNFPGHTGAVMAIWKAHSEWGSGPRGGNGLGDGVASNANLGDGGANFDNTFQGTALDTGGTNGNVHSAGPIGGAVIAFTQTPISDGWKVTYNEAFVWDDGPGEAPAGTVDLQAVATHEIGHTLGLGHSGAAGATMSPAAAGGLSMARSISADDIAGIQAIYGLASASKPEITGVSGPLTTGSTLVLTGQNFDATGNEVWFTDSAATGTPLKLTDVSSSAGGTLISVAIPSGAAPGDVLVKSSGTGGASLSNAFPLDVDGAPGEYRLVGPGVDGIAGNPQLTGSGDLTPGGSGFTLHGQLIAPSAPGVFFVALSESAVPFKGGAFYPVPILLQFDVDADVGGMLTLPASMPAAIPPGTTVVTQAWFLDGAAVQGASSTNGLTLVVP